MDQNHNLITVIIPTYNRAGLISHAIESVQRQTHATWELIIVDDGSTDNTEEIVNTYRKADARIKYARRDNSRPKGANSCRNIGLELSQGSYLKWLDSDDYLHPRCLEVQLDKMLSCSADVCFCQSGKFEERNGEIIHLDLYWSKEVSTENIIESLIKGRIRWATLSGLWKKSYLPERPFHEGLMNAQEWLFHIETSMQTPTFAFLTDVLCYVRVHTGSMSSHVSKGGRYYYNSCYAFFLVIDSLARVKPKKYRALIGHLLKKYVWYHAFVLYKGGYAEFIKLFRFYPGILYRRYQ